MPQSSNQALTAKQRIVVDSYLKGMDKLTCLRMAGYAMPESNIKQVFDSPVVQDEIRSRQAGLRRRNSIEVDDVLEGLMDAVHSAANTTELVAAWREIGRIIGAYEHAKKIEIDVKSEIRHIESVKQLERMSEKQLAELADLGDDFVLDNEPIDGDYEEVQTDDG